MYNIHIYIYTVSLASPGFHSPPQRGRWSPLSAFLQTPAAPPQSPVNTGAVVPLSYKLVYKPINYRYITYKP